MNYNYYQPYQFNNVPSQVQRLQKMRDDITEQLAQMQQQPVPQIQQTFITPQATPNYMDIPAKWVDKYEDVQNAQVYVATLFIDRNSSKFYIKDETGATPLALAIKSNGEQIAGTEMDYTPSGANVYGNVSASTLIVVPYGASKTISVGNVLTANTLVKNANIIIEKVS